MTFHLSFTVSDIDDEGRKLLGLALDTSFPIMVRGEVHDHHHLETLVRLIKALERQHHNALPPVDEASLAASAQLEESHPWSQGFDDWQRNREPVPMGTPPAYICSKCYKTYLPGSIVPNICECGHPNPRTLDYRFKFQ